MLNKLKEIIEGDDDTQSIFANLRNIKFDLDFDDEPPSFEKYIAVSYNIEDSKGNPGSLGHFFITNLKVIWQMKSDPSINLVIGLDSIVLVDVKTMPVQFGGGFKHLLTVKAQNPSQVRYEFKFSGYHPEDLAVFKTLEQIFKKVAETKSYRCTNLAVKHELPYQPMQGGEEVKTTFPNCKVFEDRYFYNAYLVVTNVRMVILRQLDKKGPNYGIPWVMMRSVEMVEGDVVKGVRLQCRGAMAQKYLILDVSAMGREENKKLLWEIRSFCEIHNKMPVLGFSFEEILVKKKEEPAKQAKDIIEFESTKVNLQKRKKAYESQGKQGNVSETEFNPEIGLMMEKLPEGVTREDLWEIIK